MARLAIPEITGSIISHEGCGPGVMRLAMRPIWQERLGRTLLADQTRGSLAAGHGAGLGAPPGCKAKASQG